MDRVMQVDKDGKIDKNLAGRHTDRDRQIDRDRKTDIHGETDRQR